MRGCNAACPALQWLEMEKEYLMRCAAAVFIILGVAAFAAAAQAQGAGDATAGRRFALQVCTPCHVVASDQVSPQRLAIAPDFTAIAKIPAMTETALHAFLASPHPSMPNLILTPQEQDDVIAYVLSLRARP
jgi:cytochrome c